MAECYTMLKQDKDAIAILDGIPSRQRTPKVSSGRLVTSPCSAYLEKEVEISRCTVQIQNNVNFILGLRKKHLL